MHDLHGLEEGVYSPKRPVVQKVQLSRMLDKRKTPIEVDYADEYMTF